MRPSLRRLLACSILVLTLAPAGAAARGRLDQFERSLLKPELLIANQRRIGLTEEQREIFIREMRATQSDLLPAQLEMSEASADLMLLLEGPRVDEHAALEAARRVLEIEQRIKSRHLVLLIRIKNLLTPEQQRRLREIRDAQ